MPMTKPTSDRSNRAKTRMKKHVVPRATAEQITRTVGVTKEERRRVQRLLRDLGCLPAPAR